MRPMEPDTLIKPITDDPVSESEDKSSDDEEEELSGDEAIYTHTRAQHKTKLNKSESDTKDQNDSINIQEAPAQEMERQSDSD